MQRHTQLANRQRRATCGVHSGAGLTITGARGPKAPTLWPHPRRRATPCASPRPGRRDHRRRPPPAHGRGLRHCMRMWVPPHMRRQLPRKEIATPHILPAEVLIICICIHIVSLLQCDHTSSGSMHQVKVVPRPRPSCPPRRSLPSVPGPAIGAADDPVGSPAVPAPSCGVSPSARPLPPCRGWWQSVKRLLEGGRRPNYIRGLMQAPSTLTSG